MSHKVFLSHSGKQHSYHTAKALNDTRLLGEYHTSSYISSKWAQTFIEFSGNKFFAKRFLNGLSGNKIYTNWRFEINEFFLNKFAEDRLQVQNAVYKRDIAFDKYVANKIRNTDSDIFWGFQGSCYNSLKAAKKSGKYTICELSTGHVLASINILSEEAKLKPEWSDSFDNLHFPDEYRKRLEEEPFLADMVVVASNFTKKTLIQAGISEDKIKVLPLGFDSRFIHFDEIKTRQNEPVQLLYTGRITQRKGISYLLDAMKDLRGVAELDIIGFVHGLGNGLSQYADYYRLLTPMNQRDLFQIYSKYDVLVLPSLFEGFGLVILEAMAAGLPVITTRHTIGADIIKNNENGFLVDIRNAKDIENAVKKLENKSDLEVQQMRLNARATAMNYTWDKYAERVKIFIDEIK